MGDQISKSSEFAKLYAGGQSRLFAFICSLVGNHDAASEILQETNVVMWEKQEEFQLGTNFTAWSFRIARFQVLAMRERVSRDRLIFSQETLDLMTGEIAEFSEQHQERQEALARCLEELPQAQGELIRRRYLHDSPVSEIASGLKRSPNTISVRLHRIRTALAECVQRRLQAAEGGGA